MDSFIKLPEGLFAAGVACGIKKSTGWKDLVLIVNDNSCVAAHLHHHKFKILQPLGEGREQ